MAKVNGFTFFASYYDAISFLSEQDKARIIIAICEYVFNGVEPNFENDILNGFWRLILPSLSKSVSRSVAGRQSEGKTKAKRKQNESKIKANESKAETNTSYKDKDKDKEIGESKLSLAESELRRERDTLKEQLKASANLIDELQVKVTELETTIRDNETPKGRLEYAKEFDEDFKLYHRKGSKKKAYERWRKLSEDDKERMRMHIPIYWQSNEPQFLKDFEGYINQRIFDSVIYDKRSGRILYDPAKADSSNGYNPSGMYVIHREDGTFLYFGGYDGYVEKDIYDGYENADRPDGATIVLNNGRGTARWNKSKTQWEVTA